MSFHSQHQHAHPAQTLWGAGSLHPPERQGEREQGKPLCKAAPEGGGRSSGGAPSSQSFNGLPASQGHPQCPPENTVLVPFPWPEVSDPLPGSCSHSPAGVTRLSQSHTPGGLGPEPVLQAPGCLPLYHMAPPPRGPQLPELSPSLSGDTKASVF